LHQRVRDGREPTEDEAPQFSIQTTAHDSRSSNLIEGVLKQFLPRGARTQAQNLNIPLTSFVSPTGIGFPSFGLERSLRDSCQLIEHLCHVLKVCRSLGYCLMQIWCDRPETLKVWDNQQPCVRNCKKFNKIWQITFNTFLPIALSAHELHAEDMAVSKLG
jgi:hypothetical protein